MMLQRAASNAYSWWWASHIRTKQSKWLEQNLQDMGEKVQIVLKLIQEDGDSFAKRAEMYYKKRPELIQFVEESYRAYRALAERYEHMSNELQNANRTLATVFPEQVQFSMDEEDEDAKSRLLEKASSTFTPKEIPKAPSDLIKDRKVIFSPASKTSQTKKATDSSSRNGPHKSGLGEPQALQEINELQKEILGLQTEKEFVKSSYENGLVKYWEIGEQIMEKHDRICKLQDEFGAGKIIEDHEARSIMAAAALKSCHETLAQLQEKQRKTTEDAKTERKRIKDFWEKLSSLQNEFRHSLIDKEKRIAEDGNVKARDNLRNSEKEGSIATQARKDLEILKGKVREHFETGSGTSLSVTEMADKVDEVVDKVINLDCAVSSHAALVKRLREENDDLQTHIRNLEDDKESLISDAGAMSKKLRDMEEKFDRIQELNKNVKNQNISLQTNFTEAQCSIDHLSEKLHDVKPDEELEITSTSQTKEKLSAEKKIKKERAQEEKHNLDSHCKKLHSTKAGEGQKQPDKSVKPDSTCQDLPDVSQNKKLKQVNSSAKEEGSFVEAISKEDSSKHKISDNEIYSGKEKDALPAYSTDHWKKDTRPATKDDNENLSRCEEQKVQDTGDIIIDTEAKKEVTLREDEPDMQHLFTSGLENKEKLLLNEYPTVLHNSADVNKNLDEIEKKNEDNFINKQVTELWSANAMKDEEIRSLRQKLSLMQRLLDGNKEAKEQKSPADHQRSNLLDVSLFTLLTSTPAPLPGEEEESKEIKVTPVYHLQSTNPVEEKIRISIDEVLEKNLDFWLRFSISFSQIQKFESEVRDLQAELSKIEEKVKRQEGSSSPRYYLKSDARPLYKHLREIHTELTVWLEKSVLLKDELKSRFSSICDIEEQIRKALKENAKEDEFTFTSHQAAKFQGEILNMKQENNKVADELQAGLDNVTAIQLEVEQTLTKLNEEFKISGTMKNSDSLVTHSESRSRVPLRSFIFGVKPKTQRPSLFSCMTPVRNKKYNFRQGNSAPL